MKEYKKTPRTADLANVVNLKPIDKCNYFIGSIIDNQLLGGATFEAANMYHSITILDWPKAIHITTHGTSIVPNILKLYPNINIYRHKTLIGETPKKSMLRNKIVAAMIGRLGIVNYSFWGIVRIKFPWLIIPLEKVVSIFIKINYSKLQFCSEFWIRAARLFIKVCPGLDAEKFLPCTAHDSEEFILIAKYRHGQKIK